MTDTQTESQVLAERIADGGRAALLERLRGAYQAAANTHADLITISDDRLEAMIQDAVGRADGLQWRRALAEVAAGELGVTVSEALVHPAVADAQRLVGAPSYDQSLAELIARPVPPVRPLHGAGPGEEPEHVSANDVVDELPAEPQPVEYETELYDVVASFTEEEDDHDAAPAQAPSPAPSASAPAAVAETQPSPAAPNKRWVPPAAVTAAPPVPAPPAAPVAAPAAPVAAPAAPVAAPAARAPWEALGEALDEHPGGALVPVSSDPGELVFPAVHEGGVANLPKRHDGLGVCLSSAGVDILEGEHEILGRLLWDEIETLQVVSLRPKRRNPEPRARLIIRTPQGDASFGVPGITGDELRDRIEPLLARYGQH